MVNYQLSELEQEFWNNIFQKCYVDETFKRELIANPAKALEPYKNGKSLDMKGFKLVVTDQSEPAIYINIPVNEDTLELTEEQLEAVSGGSCFWSCVFSGNTTTVNR